MKINIGHYYISWEASNKKRMDDHKRMIYFSTVRLRDLEPTVSKVGERLKEQRERGLVIVVMPKMGIIREAKHLKHWQTIPISTRDHGCKRAETTWSEIKFQTMSKVVIVTRGHWRRLCDNAFIFTSSKPILHKSDGQRSLTDQDNSC